MSERTRAKSSARVCERKTEWVELIGKEAFITREREREKTRPRKGEREREDETKEGREREREREDETKEGRESERIIMAVSKLLQYNRPNPPILTSLGSSFVSAAV